MKKELHELFDEATSEELDLFAEELETTALSEAVLASIKEKVYAKTKPKNAKPIWLRFCIIAACFCLIVSGFVLASIPGKTEPETLPEVATEDDSRTQSLPLIKVSASPAPQYYGSGGGSGGGAEAEEIMTGLSVTAEYVEVLPDTYTFYDDQRQNEYRLLRLKTQKLLKGEEMTDEFYFMVPVDFMTDFSIFDKFVILDMAQYTYDYSVLYNKTQDKAEQLYLVIFCYGVYDYNLMGENFLAYDEDGNFDNRLWTATSAWRAHTVGAQPEKTITGIEAYVENVQRREGDGVYVHLLNTVVGEGAKMLEEIMSLENGVYIPGGHSSILHGSPDVQFHARRYIDGFVTNEYIRICSPDHSKIIPDPIMTKAHFDEADMKALPDLPAAIATVAAAYDKGEILPPHIENHEEYQLFRYSIFGWYAKTEDGVLGIVRVEWDYVCGYEDDAYFIIEYGEDACKPIDRDDLISRFGEYELEYIYLDEYNEKGRSYSRIVV